MNRRVFTREQIEELLKNPNVIRCSEKAITYAPDFKLRAVKEHQEHYAAVKAIFLKAGFDLETIGRNTPRWCLKHWSKIYKTKGMQGLKTESRGRMGGRIKRSGLSEKDKLKRLEAEVAYLKAENDFLAKLRAKRAE